MLQSRLLCKARNPSWLCNLLPPVPGGLGAITNQAMWPMGSVLHVEGHASRRVSVFLEVTERATEQSRSAAFNGCTCDGDHIQISVIFLCSGEHEHSAQRHKQIFSTRRLRNARNGTLE